MKSALIVNATAGSGKTTTIVNGLHIAADKISVKDLKFKPSDEQLLSGIGSENEFAILLTLLSVRSITPLLMN